MKFRTTIILLVLVIGLGAFLLMYTARQPSASAFKEEQSRLFAGSEFQEPGASGLAGTFGPRDEARTAPRRRRDRARAAGRRPEARMAHRQAPERAGRFRRRHRHPRRDRVSEDHAQARARKGQPLDLKSYGLEPPERSITFGVGEKSWTLNVGAKTPDRQSVYVARADAKTPVVCVAPVSVLEKASERVNDLRDKAALRFDKAAVTRVDLVPAGGAPLTLSREATGWRLAAARFRTKPTRRPSRACSTRSPRCAWTPTTSSPMVTTAAPRSSASTSPASNWPSSKGQTSRALLLGADVKDHPDKCYARREGDSSVFALEKQAADGLMKSAADLRSRVALDFNPDEVTAITIEPAAEPGKPASNPAGEPAQTIRLVHPKDQWTMEEPAGVTVDPERAVLFLNDLHNLEVTDWVDNRRPSAWPSAAWRRRE